MIKKTLHIHTFPVWILARKTVNKWAWQAVQFCCGRFWSEQNPSGWTEFTWSLKKRGANRSDVEKGRTS